MNAITFFIFIGTIRAIALVPIEMVMINYKELYMFLLPILSLKGIMGCGINR